MVYPSSKFDHTVLGGIDPRSGTLDAVSTVSPSSKFDHALCSRTKSLRRWSLDSLPIEHVGRWTIVKFAVSMVFPSSKFDHERLLS